MRLAIMQPYFLPYIGYFQLIAAVDSFVIYDNIKYTKKGWINRNRFLQNGSDAMFSLPLKNDADHLDIRERDISKDFNRDKLLNQFRGAYQRAPFFKEAMPLIERITAYPELNLFQFLKHSIVETCAHLGINTPIATSSCIDIDHGLKAQDKVLAICQAMGTQTYLNSIGGLELYSKDAFQRSGLELRFLKSRAFEYPQFDTPFVPWLSIIDVMMFNPLERIQACISNNYDLI